MTKLTALKVKSLNEPGRYTDGRGLMLVIAADGSKKWVLRIQVNGKRRDLGLGAAANVSLSEARTAADEMRLAFKAGRDPVKDRNSSSIPTFAEAAVMVHEEHKPSWRNAKHAAQWLSTLESYMFPSFGDVSVSEIDTGMIRDALAHIWLTKPETARRVRQRIGTVLDFAHAKGWRDHEAPIRAVSRGLPKQPRQATHYSAMSWQEVPTFVSNMSATLKVSETVRLALEFLILTAARSGEVRGATWDEVDVDNRLWAIPAERMKGGKGHRVPLSGRAIEILKEMEGNEGIIFEGRRAGKPISDMTLTMPLRRAGLHVTVHGFRSSFRDWCAEAADTPREIAEAALAHTLSNKIEAAYARTDYFDKRRVLMDKWERFLLCR